MNSKIVDNFRLVDHNGNGHELYYYSNKKAIVIISHGIGCPIVRKNISAIQLLNEQFYSKGIQFFFLNANIQDTCSLIKEEADSYSIDIPILKDNTQFISHSLGFLRTANAIIIDPKTWTVVFEGPVDSSQNYGFQSRMKEIPFLKNALNQILSNQVISPSKEDAKGCLIAYEDSFQLDGETISYNMQIVPIFRDNCLKCHKKEGVAPWAMSNFLNVKGFSSMIKEVVLTKRMPPYHIDPSVGEFSNTTNMSFEDERLLLQWINSGAKKDKKAIDSLGKYHDDLVALDKKQNKGKPDFSINLGEQIGHANELMEYRYFLNPSGITEDKWIKRSDFKTLNKEGLHHAVSYFVSLDMIQKVGYDMERLMDLLSSDSNIVNIYAPGYDSFVLPPDTGVLLPKDSYILTELHYTPIGKEVVDFPMIDLFFWEDKQSFSMEFDLIIDVDFLIPANEKSHTISKEIRIDQDIKLVYLNPHGHLRVKRFFVDVIYPEGTKESLINVPFFDFNWQNLYSFEKLKFIPKGSVLKFEGIYDNSAMNLTNPDSSNEVRHGHQAEDEMFVLLFGFIKVKP
ncbi:redoxin domain-containing protein [bacterium]|nr:redoxin domain-containing protein [bacterium]